MLRYPTVIILSSFKFQEVLPFSSFSNFFISSVPFFGRDDSDGLHLRNFGARKANQTYRCQQDIRLTGVNEVHKTEAVFSKRVEDEPTLNWHRINGCWSVYYHTLRFKSYWATFWATLPTFGNFFTTFFYFYKNSV